MATTCSKDAKTNPSPEQQSTAQQKLQIAKTELKVRVAFEALYDVYLSGTPQETVEALE